MIALAGNKADLTTNRIGEPLGKTLFRSCTLHLGIARFFFFFFFGGGGLNPFPDGLGTFLEKNFPSSNGHLLDFGGGLNPCPDGLGHVFRERIFQVQTGICLIWGGLNPCPDGLGHLFRENGKKKMVKW